MSHSFPESFKPISVNDIPLLRRMLFASPERSCEFNVVNLYVWSSAFLVRWQIWEEHLWIHYHSEAEGVDALMWAGASGVDDPSPSSLAKISAEMRAAGYSGNIQHVREDYFAAHPELATYFTVRQMDDDFAEYIHSVDSLATLAGERFSKKRNLIKQFRRHYADAEYRVLSDREMPDALGMAEAWLAEHPDSGAAQLQEEASAWRHLNDATMEYLGITGYGVLVDAKMVAFAICSRIAGDIWTEHFEKALREYTGAAQALNQFMAQSLPKECKWLNREQDMGSPGLRQAKLSYHPEMLLKNYEILPNQ